MFPNTIENATNQLLIELGCDSADIETLHECAAALKMSKSYLNKIAPIIAKFPKLKYELKYGDDHMENDWRNGNIFIDVPTGSHEHIFYKYQIIL